MVFVAVVETAHESWRAIGLVVGVAVSIADATPVFEAIIRIVLRALFPTCAVTAHRTVGIQMASDHGLALFTDFLVCAEPSLVAVSVRKAPLAAVG